ncbi:Ldh family oxidoreductase [Devosia rhodophyticola]|uniref:Ldh family oxidoreductase n=1 Tax=Devosia rhodophyticola TaxID=3026423 RepID=A0ABY7YUU3_9HYPH|nr:Ldh family oxidoreductase [Devosia rhodophyticola]WDR04810.1 Ldh family oxidoreductase [Devosia rhodophyticola]
MPLVDAVELRDVATAALKGAGVPEGGARLQADLLLDAELRAVPSHGFLRLERLVARIGNGVASATASGSHDWRGPGFVSVDGQNGLGPVVAEAALAAISPAAKSQGIAVAAVANANHIGMLAYYAEAIARAGQVGIVLSTSEALVHPYGGRQALIGTNPIAIGVPSADGPFVVDLATSLVSMGEIHDRAHRGQALPEGWALDAQGNTTTDAEAAKAGAIAPFGAAKGYALGLAFELMVTALTGTALGRDVVGTLDADQLCNKGDVFIVIDPVSGQGEAIARYLEILRQAEPADGFDQVLIPGERGRALKAERLRGGVPVADSVWSSMQRLRDTALARGEI